MSRPKVFVKGWSQLLILLWCLSSISPGLVAAVQVGEKAPDFTLPDQDGRPVRLGEILARQQNVVLAFYIQAFTPG